MTAGILAAKGEDPAGLVLIAPGSVIQDACSEKYMEAYGDNAELIVVKGGNHMITRKKKEDRILLFS